MKDATYVEGALLLVSTIAVFVLGRSRSDERRKGARCAMEARQRRLLVTSALLLTSCVFLWMWFANFPHQLCATEHAVLQRKAANRTECERLRAQRQQWLQQKQDQQLKPKAQSQSKQQTEQKDEQRERMIASSEAVELEDIFDEDTAYYARLRELILTNDIGKRLYREQWQPKQQSVDSSSEPGTAANNAPPSLPPESHHHSSHSHYGSVRRGPLGRRLSALANRLVFSTGAMYSILPFLFAAVLREFLRRRQKRTIDFAGMIDFRVLKAVSVSSVLVFVVFYGYVDAQRLERCIHISGHWYTYTVSTFSCVFVLANLLASALFPSPSTAVSTKPGAAAAEPQQQQVERSEKGRKATWFVVLLFVLWFALHQMLSLHVLEDTQRFHHDDAEARDGILWGTLSAGVFALLAAVF